MSPASAWQRVIPQGPRIGGITHNAFKVSPPRSNSRLSHGNSNTSSNSSAADQPRVASLISFNDTFSSTRGLYLQRLATAGAGMQKSSHGLPTYITLADVASAYSRRPMMWPPAQLAETESSVGIFCMHIVEEARAKETDVGSNRPQLSQPSSSTHSLARKTQQEALQNETQGKAKSEPSSHASSSAELTGPLLPTHNYHADTLNKAVDEGNLHVLESNRRHSISHSSSSSMHNGSRATSRSQPHIIALIDGDGYLFSEDVLRKGRDGGIEAATRIAQAVADAFDGRSDFRLSIYFFMNERGWQGILRGNDHQYSYEELADFLSGFQTPPFNYVIDAGQGKERVDAKLKELLRVSLRSADTERVILGVSHDNGYIPNIEGEVLFKDKIMLLSGDRVTDAYTRGLPHLPTMAVPGLFDFRDKIGVPEHERVTRVDRRDAGNAKSGNRRVSAYGKKSLTPAASQRATPKGRGNRDAHGARANEEENPSVGQKLGPEQDAKMRAIHRKEPEKVIARAVRKRVPKKDPKDRKALVYVGKGATARVACKNAWIAEHPKGTEGQFQAYWETEGQMLYKDWKPPNSPGARASG